jgi:hypothetical protein
VLVDAVLRAKDAALSLRVFWRAAVAAVLMNRFLVLISAMHVLPRIGLGMAAYFILLTLIGGLSRQSLELLKRSSDAPSMNPKL